MNQYELERLRVDASLPGVTYGYGDAVRVTSGDEAGEAGRVVALLAVEPRPVYVIEFPNGSSVVSLQPDLERAV